MLAINTVYRCLILWLTYPCWALMAIWMAYLMPAGWANYRHYKVLHRHIIHITPALNGHLKTCTVQHCTTLYSMGKIYSRVKCSAENHLYMPLTTCSWFSVWRAIESLGGYSPVYAYVSGHCPACRTTLVATRFRVAVICPIIQVPHCIRVFFYFV